MVGLKAAWRRQDQVGVAGGFVDVNVMGHKKVELLQCLLKLNTIRRGQNGIAGAGDERPDLAFTGRQDFFGQNRNRQVAFEFRQTADSRFPACKFVFGSRFPDQFDRRVGKHLSARSIEVSRNQIDGVNDPMTKPAMWLRGDAHSPIDNGSFGCRKFSGKICNRRRVDACDFRNVVGSKFRDGVFQLFNTFCKAVQSVRNYRTLLKQRVQNRGQQKHVSSGANEMVFGCQLGRLRATGVDQDDFAASTSDRFQSVLYIGSRHQAAVGGRGIGAQNQHVFGVVDVRDWNQQSVSEHLAGRKMMWKLVYRRRGESVSSIERLF